MSFWFIVVFYLEQFAVVVGRINVSRAIKNETWHIVVRKILHIVTKNMNFYLSCSVVNFVISVIAPLYKNNILVPENINELLRCHRIPHVLAVLVHVVPVIFQNLFQFRKSKIPLCRI